MKACDFNKFLAMWKELQAMYKQTVSETAGVWIFQAFEEYDLKDIQQAIPIALQRLEFAPKPSDIIKVIKEMHGEDEATLEAKANAFYTELNKGFSIAHDIVTTDKRAVIAFYQCFNDIREFGNRPLNAEVFDRKAFVNAYVRAKSYWMSNQISKHTNVIRGIYYNDPKPPVRFIGNIQACMEIAKQIYTEQEPRLLSCEHPKAIENKANKSERYVTKDELDTLIHELEASLKGGANA